MDDVIVEELPSFPGIYLHQGFPGTPRGERPLTMLLAVKDRGYESGAYSPEEIEIMSAALAARIESLPEPVSATMVHQLALSILANAGRGERDVATLVRMALVELRIAPHH
jgi:hypothetical protein